MIEINDYQYIDNVMDQYPQLDNDEIKALARRVRSGDKEARNLMILHNMRLVVKTVKPFTSPQTYNDCVQQVVEGLIRAVDKFDPDLGYNFSTYALWWIKQALRIWLYERHRVYIPRYMHDAMLKIKKYCSENERDPAVIAKKIGMEEDKITHALNALSLHYVSMDVSMPSLDGEGCLAEILVDDKDDFVEFEDQSDNRQITKQLMDLLNPREQQIMRMYFGFDGEPKTFVEIARKLGISHERVRQLYMRALESLKSGKPSSTMIKVRSVGTCRCGCGQKIETTQERGGIRKFASLQHKNEYYRILRKQRRKQRA